MIIESPKDINDEIQARNQAEIRKDIDCTRQYSPHWKTVYHATDKKLTKVYLQGVKRLE